MGKVRDEAPAAKAGKAAPKPAAMPKGRGRVTPFFANLLQTNVVKPNQGRNARLWTFIGLVLLVGAGLYQLRQVALEDSGPAARIVVPFALGAALLWVIYRAVQFPPFVEFLIATEAEMKKVSWTSRDDLYRATMVVLVTVLVLSVYLFGVDLVWSRLLMALGILRFDGGGGFGAQNG